MTEQGVEGVSPEPECAGPHVSAFDCPVHDPRKRPESTAPVVGERPDFWTCHYLTLAAGIVRGTIPRESVDTEDLAGDLDALLAYLATPGDTRERKTLEEWAEELEAADDSLRKYVAMAIRAVLTTTQGPQEETE